MAKPKKNQRLALRIDSEVARTIRQHARSQSKTEVCGVLIGSETPGVTTVEACISGENATQGGSHVTFTQDTWEHIYKIKDRDFPDARIVGWYHSHPGFGVFLSDHDTFIHKNFFSSPQQVAWVYDPHSDEEGVFGWQGDRLERLPQFDVVDDRGGELAGASGKPEPVYETAETAEDWRDAAPEPTAPPSRRKPREKPAEREDLELSRLSNIVSAVFSHLAVLIIGGLLVWYFLPHLVAVPVVVDPYTGQVTPLDPRTGQPMRMLPDNPADHRSVSPNASPAQPAAPPASSPNTSKPNPNDSPRGDVHK